MYDDSTRPIYEQPKTYVRCLVITAIVLDVLFLLMVIIGIFYVRSGQFFFYTILWFLSLGLGIVCEIMSIMQMNGNRGVLGNGLLLLYLGWLSVCDFGIFIAYGVVYLMNYQSIIRISRNRAGMLGESQNNQYYHGIQGGQGGYTAPQPQYLAQYPPSQPGTPSGPPPPQHPHQVTGPPASSNLSSHPYAVQLL